MTTVKKFIIPTLALVTVIGAGAYGVSKVNAAMMGGYGHDTMINRLVEKFGLNKDEVQAVFDQQHEERQAEMKTREEERLTQAVTDGKLTEAQKKLILEKREQMREDMDKFRDENQNLTQEQIREKMQQHRTELQQWAKDNNISEQYLMGGGMGRGGFGKGGMGRGGDCPMAD